VHAALAGGAELVGGLLIALGLLTPVGAALVIAVMVVAIVTVHLAKGFFVSDGGAEYNLVIIAASAALAFTGAGAYSLDAVDGLALSGWLPGVLAVLAGLVLGAGALAARRVAPVARGA
jgi:putative oxidoreductase